MIHIHKLNKVFSLSIIAFVLILSIFLPLMINNTGNITNNTISNDSFINNAFIVHKSNNSSESKYYLIKNDYYIDIASSNNKDFYLNVSGNNCSFHIYTDNWEFHGFYIKNSGFYYFNTSGSGKWILSLSAQDPGYIYSYNVTAPTSFVIVPAIINPNRIEIEVNKDYKMTLYNSILNPVKSSVDGKIYYNITGKQYNGVDFVVLSVNNNTSICILWNTFKVSHKLNIKYESIEIGIVIIAVISVSIYIFFKNNHKKRN